LLSWLLLSSNPPKPSQSITRHSSSFLFFIVCFHNHNPFVQGFIEDPTLKPLFSYCSNIRFTKNDFPVLYLPTTVIIPSFVFNSLKYFILSSLNTNPFSLSNVINGIACIPSVYWFIFYSLLYN
jgi:hypothetical protein